MAKRKYSKKEIQELAELYTLGVLDKDETDGFVSLLEEGDEYLENELQSFTDVVKHLGFSVSPVNPPAGLKKRLFQRIRDTKNSGSEKIVADRKQNEKASLNDFLPKFREDGHHLVRPVVDWSNEIGKPEGSKELSDAIQQSIDQLQPVDKAMIMMSDLEERSNREIATILGLSILVVKARLHRSHLFLRGKLAVHLGHSPT